MRFGFAWLLLMAGCVDTGRGTLTDDDDAGDDDAADDDAADDDAADDDTGDDDTGDDDTGPTAPDPFGPGPYGVATDTDTATVGDTDLPLSLSWPDGGVPAPVVVLTHGFQLGPSDYASWAERLAPWGYAVVAPQLPSSLLSPPTHDALRDDLEGLLDWIDAQAAGPRAATLDPGRLALVGHSMGGKLSLYLAATDARVDAVVGLDPVDAGGGPLSPPGTPGYPSITPERMDDVTAPLLLLGETTNSQGSFLTPACAPEAENFERYFEAATSPALSVELLGANHMSFLDNPNCLACLACPAGTAAPADVRATATGLTVAFLEQRLRGAAWAANELTGAAMAARVAAGELTFVTANGF